MANMENYVLFMSDCKIVKIPTEAVEEFIRHDLHYIAARRISTLDGHITYSITEDQRRKHIMSLGIITAIIIKHDLIDLYEPFENEYYLSTINLSADILFTRIFKSIIAAIKYFNHEAFSIPQYLHRYVMSIADGMIPYYKFDRDYYLKKAGEITTRCKLEIGVHVSNLDDPKNAFNSEDNRDFNRIKLITNNIKYDVYRDDLSGDIVATISAKTRNIFIDNIQPLIYIAKAWGGIGSCRYGTCHHAGIIAAPSCKVSIIGVDLIIRLLLRINSAIYFLNNLDEQFITCTPLVPAVYDEMLIFADEYLKIAPSDHSKPLESVKTAMRKLYDSYDDRDAVDFETELQLISNI